jgi:hypothetical protein
LKLDIPISVWRHNSGHIYLRDVNAVCVGSANVDAVCEVLGVGSSKIVATVVLAADDLEVPRRSREDSTIAVVAAVAGGRGVLSGGPNVGGLLIQGGYTTLQVTCTCPRYSFAPSSGIA